MERLQIKKLFLDNISPCFKQRGYTFISCYDPKFILKTQEYFAICSFIYSPKQDMLYGGKLNLCLWGVENLILEIRYPKQDFTSYISKDEYFFSTVNDLYGYFKPKDIDLNSKESIIEYADEVKRYIETDGQKFIDTYSFLPNVLTEMDRLRLEGKYWHEILSGGPEYLFRGLIISKLCNDPDFHNKRKYTDSIFYGDPDEWIPYYEKLKTRLETLEPLYSMDSDGIYQPIPQPILPKTTTTEASSNLEIDNKTEIKNSDLIPETVIEIEHFDTVHLEKLTKFLSNIHKHTIEASQARDDDMLNREELLYFQEIYREQINKAIGDTPIHKAMKLERIEIFPNNTNEYAIYYYALDLGTFTTLAVNVTLSPEGWVEDSRMIVD